MIAPIRQPGSAQPAPHEPRHIGDVLPEVLARYGIVWPRPQGAAKAIVNRRIRERRRAERRTRGYTPAARKSRSMA